MSDIANDMRVDILIYDGCLGSEVFAFADTLTMAIALNAAGKPAVQTDFEIRLISVDGRPKTLAGGFATAPTTKSSHCDLLVIPGMEFCDREALVARAMGMSDEQKLIRQHWQLGRHIAAICVGAFVVAASGVAASRNVATGWPVMHLLSSVDSSLIVETDALVVTDGALKTSGAVTAAYDLALDIVGNQLGKDIAIRLRKILLLEPSRPGQQAFGRITDKNDVELTPVHLAKAYLRNKIDCPFELSAVANAAGTSVRTLQRNFKKQTGITPLSFHQELRIERAKQLLETSNVPVSQIAVDVGFAEEATFRKLFRKITGMSPGEFRRRFQLLRT
jgi:transcriptional regulator GlxA family with amidase domain